MTVRQVFYQLVARTVVEKSETDYQGIVIRLMTDMRLDGTLPFAWVVDEVGAFGSHTPTTASPMPSNKQQNSTDAAPSPKHRTTLEISVRERCACRSRCGTLRQTMTCR